MKKAALFLLAALMAGSTMNAVVYAKMTDAKVKAGVSKHIDKAAEAAKKAETARNAKKAKAKAEKEAKKAKAKAEKAAMKAKAKAEKEAKKAKARAEKEAAKLKEAAQ